MKQHEIILTSSTKEKLEKELAHLRTVERPAVTEAIKRAREYGDLSENFEYQAARQSQAILNGRIAEVEAILEKSRVIEDSTDNSSVSIGSVVTLYDEEIEDDWTVTIVDAASADPDNDRISYISSIGTALMQKRVGDVVEVHTPGGQVWYEIKALVRE